ncbi:MAG: RluA family pseudouridine synthase [Eubacteriales bacterium]
MDIRIPPEFEGALLRSFIKKKLGLSARQLTRLKNHPSGIMLDGQRVTVRQILAQGQTLTLALEDESSSPTIVPQGDVPPIVYEDEDIIVLDKPAGMTSHPSRGHYSTSLANALAAYFEAKDTPFVFRAVNRLDKDTTGLVVVAKNALSAHHLSLDMREGRIKKSYLALLEGDLSKADVKAINERFEGVGGSLCFDGRDGYIDAGIKRCGESIITRQIASDGKKSLTRFTLLGAGEVSLVRCYPQTGRTHQIRVHFSSIGYPLLGDDLYGAIGGRMDRQALHCEQIILLHPSHGGTLTLRAPVPEDMAEQMDTGYENNKAVN